MSELVYLVQEEDRDMRMFLAECDKDYTNSNGQEAEAYVKYSDLQRKQLELLDRLVFKVSTSQFINEDNKTITLSSFGFIINEEKQRIQSGH